MKTVNRLFEKNHVRLFNALIPSAKKTAISFCFLPLAVLLLSCANQALLVMPPPKVEPLRTLEATKADFARPQLVASSNQLEKNLGVSLVAVGDVMLGTWVTSYLDSSGATYPFEPTRHILEAADFAIANLEAPFTDRGEAVKDKTFTFRVPPKHAVGLKESGFDILHLANNHILDYGPEGLFDTITTLDSLALTHIGAGENIAAALAPAIFERDGIDGKKLRLGFLGFSMTHPEEFYAGKEKPGTAFPFYERYVAALDSLAPKVDIMVVSFHWGAEKMVKPKAYQIETAHLAIEHGADIVLGHHPHVLQGVELYRPRTNARPGLIAYSLGNFAFGSYSRSSRTSIILKCVLDNEGVLYARCIPINVFNDEVEGQPRLLQGEAATAVIDSLNAISRHLNNGKNVVSADGFIVPVEETAILAPTASDSLAPRISSKP
ncbi:CapA family protein [candidate division KSB1 bacterium]|nr:CapA family protein [candidate division KSB1 bacterium]